MRFGRVLIVEVNGIGMEGRENVGLELFLIHKYCGGQYWCIETCSVKGNWKLLLCEYWPKVDRVDFCIITISPFWVHIPSSCQGVGFGTKSARAETYCEVELWKKLRPVSLSTRQNLWCAEVFEVLVISDNVNRDCGTLKVMPPLLKGCKNR